ncbi:MAG: tRNA 2-thiouridine(34) synthase MnmA [Coriobacteriia bacterium]|nr:tRNA 2-thiouridine(34) synthase MnmA [Coriobacteriia bacterium]
MRTKRIAIALSGGVDSSVAAALLQEQGYEVEGVTLRLHDGFPIDAAIAAAEALGIPHHIVDLREEFERLVIAAYAGEYAEGRTPNPCITCNREIKFGLLWEWARDHDFDMLATGHYARIGETTSGDPIRLLRGVDPQKDQSYFMYRIARERLRRVLFPLGDLHKSAVKEMAATRGLPAATAKESTGTCFVDALGHDVVVKRYHPHAYEPGDIVNEDGAVLGQHRGVAHYTVGQRKGIGIGGLEEPYYVSGIDAVQNRVIVGVVHDSEQSIFVCHDIVVDEQAWGEAHARISMGAEMNAEISRSGFLELDVVLRYHMEPIPAFVEVNADDTLTIALLRPAIGVSAGQSAVCYFRDMVVAGGIIT